ncbi:MAG: cryptochrome/photolyase family protein [Pseudomonadota bacterium]
MTQALIVFPNQLFAKHPGLKENPDQIVLIEDSLFFGDAQYPARFHKQKLWLHRASMMKYEARLLADGWPTRKVNYEPNISLLVTVLKDLAESGVDHITTCDPVDYTLTKRLTAYTVSLGLELTVLPTPMFLNTSSDNRRWRETQKRWFMAEFYKYQRRRFSILMRGDDPEGGQWSFDEDNRKKVPKKLLGSIPRLSLREPDDMEERARTSVERDFPTNYGSIEELYWPTTHEAAEIWLKDFLTQRFEQFGPYEDAIVEREVLLWHSAITPMLNIGLLTPQQVIDAALTHIEDNAIPLNSAEGFIRQIIGWREFMRATYEDLGVRMRTTNHWGHRAKIPRCFWNGETGIAPVDDTIKRILKTGYCHHIERLMVLGGFMFLCEFDPDEIYGWFMEMFVDAYDWVMVPNAYAMSQNADGGLITTKPYFSGSAYIKKMSNHPKGDWCEVWDGLYWRWIWKNADQLEKNPRWAMMVAMVRKMDHEKRENHLKTAEKYLKHLS